MTKVQQEHIQALREEIARKRAHLDQHERRINDQYPLYPPWINFDRMIWLDELRFGIEIDEWELKEYMLSLEAK